MHNAEPNGRATTKPTTFWNITRDGTGKRKRFALRFLEKQSRGGADQRIAHCDPISSQRHKIINAQRDAQAIIARPKIRCARWNTNGDLLHESKRRKARPSLPWAACAARKRSVKDESFWKSSIRGRVCPINLRTTIWIEPELLRTFTEEGTDAHRLCTYAEGWVERYAADVIVSYQSEVARERLTTELCLWALNCDFKLGRIFGRYLPKQNAEREPPTLLMGDAETNLQSIATEHMLRYGIDFTAGYSVGLFIDQRANRQFVRRVAPKTLLNCFAYTCSFSVAAASSGATTVNVDLSKKSLARGRENFGINSLPTNDHRFLADDVFEVLPRLARRGEKFDTIILDPPTFSRSWRGKTFQVERDFETLLLLALDLAKRDSRILLSTNCTKLDRRALEVTARFCLKTARRAGTFHREPALPDFPAGTGASTIWLTLR